MVNYSQKNSSNFTTTAGNGSSSLNPNTDLTGNINWVISPSDYQQNYTNWTAADTKYSNPYSGTSERLSVIELELVDIKKMLKELLREKLLLEQLRK